MGKTEEWERTNPVLLEGMIGVEIKPDGNRRIKIGDGKHNWKASKLKALDSDDIEGLRNELDQVAELSAKVKGIFEVNKSLEEILATMTPEDFVSITALLSNMANKISEETDTRERIITALETRIETLTT